MTLWEALSTFPGNLITGTLSGGGLFAYLRSREESTAARVVAAAKLESDRLVAEGHSDDNKLERDNAAIIALTDRVNELERELSALKSERDRIRVEANVAKRVSHDMSNIANSAHLLLIERYTDINQILIECGKPPRYPDPGAAARQDLDRITESFAATWQRVYDNAVKREDVSQLQHTIIEVQKEKVIQSVQADPSPPVVQ